MSLLFLDSFDTTTNPLDKWTSISGATIQGTVKRTGAQAMRLQSHSASKTLAPGDATAIVGGAFRASQLGGNPFLSVRLDSTIHVAAQMNGDGTITVKHGDGTTLFTSTESMSVDSWPYIELKVTVANSGTVALHVNEVEWGTFTGDTQNGGTAAWNNIYLVGVSGSESLYVDDLYVCDSVDATATQGYPNDDFLGDIVVRSGVPIADTATADWTKSSGSDGYALIDEVPPSATDYIESSVVGDRSTFQMTQLSSTADVLGVQTSIWAHKTDGGLREVAPTFDQVSDHTKQQHALEVTDRAHIQIIGLNPETSAAWTCDEIDDARWGVKMFT